MKLSLTFLVVSIAVIAQVLAAPTGRELQTHSKHYERKLQLEERNSASIASPKIYEPRPFSLHHYAETYSRDRSY
ncbi:hypothetical protein CROQUDRAFT_111473 [Cronartium quercuum f. sp. fusiforme G11]|uniref:Uncharacterized protein n=1 Tax=Cronartium quercuum f. sp. fusiforme G11 TaxID=708437 RepID=A0A9P6N6H5_9BASI|nr:hypothetical protein CROQUDRAFT_111473 [Cronartium quercuum f. sp. fusiforme G11]